MCSGSDCFVRLWCDCWCVGFVCVCETVGCDCLGSVVIYEFYQFYCWWVVEWLSQLCCVVSVFAVIICVMRFLAFFWWFCRFLWFGEFAAVCAFVRSCSPPVCCDCRFIYRRWCLGHQGLVFVGGEQNKKKLALDWDEVQWQPVGSCDSLCWARKFLDKNKNKNKNKRL